MNQQLSDHNTKDVLERLGWVIGLCCMILIFVTALGLSIGGAHPVSPRGEWILMDLIDGQLFADGSEPLVGQNHGYYRVAPWRWNIARGVLALPFVALPLLVLYGFVQLLRIARGKRVRLPSRRWFKWAASYLTLAGIVVFAVTIVLLFSTSRNGLTKISKSEAEAILAAQQAGDP